MKKFLSILAVAVLLAGAACFVFQDEIADFGRELTPAELKIREYAKEHHVSRRKYPKSLIALLDRNPETEEFVLNYPFREETDVDWSAYDRSQGVPLFLQWDPQWGYETYGSDMIAITGCGPTCLAMAGYYVTGDEKFTPDQVAAFSEENGYYAKGSGSSWTLISEGGVKLGLNVTEIPLVEKRIVDNLKAGNPIICSVRAGDFTSSGHYIVMVGYEDGKIRVNDPNSVANSEKLWTYDQVAPQIRNLWVIR